MFHQPDAGDVGEQFREQGIGMADQPAEQVRGDGQAELQRQGPGEVVEQAAQTVPRPTRREAGIVLAQVQRAVMMISLPT
jgi:hypothetical protein